MDRSVQPLSTVLESLEQVVTIKEEYFEFKHEQLLNLPYPIYYPIEKAINQSKNLKELAAALPPHYKMDLSALLELENKRSPGDAFLHKLSDLGMSFLEIVELMKKIEFWSGLENCCDDVSTILVENIPSKVYVKPGEPLEISCKAAGIPVPKYQWFYSPNRNTQPYRLDGQDKCKLMLKNPSSGVVCCSICNIYNNIFTAVCEVIVQRPAIPGPHSPSPRKQRIQYSARGKAALLIGNGNYHEQTVLKAPEGDILSIGNELNAMGFKTLMCKDLDLAGMNNVLNNFIGLLMNDGVYGVLYFAGHGFETTEGSYLMPTDCKIKYTPNECISVSDIHRRVLEKNPALCLIMLDVCRTRKTMEKNKTGDEKQSEPTVPKANRSTLLVHATNENMAAFETKGKEGYNAHSLFAKHLLKHIREDITVIDLMTIKVIRGFAEDKTADKKNQYPEVKMTLASDRRLTDKSNFDGSTRIHVRNLHSWEEVTKKPKNITLKSETVDLGCIVKITFTNTYSNCLEVYIACFETDANDNTSTVETTAKIIKSNFVNLEGEIPFLQLKLTPNKRDTKVQELFKGTTQKFLSLTAYEISCLERLHVDLLIDIQIEVKTDSDETKSKMITDINLHRPLLSGLDFPESSNHVASSSGSSVLVPQLSQQSSIGSLRLPSCDSDSSLQSVQGEPDITTLRSNPQGNPRTFPIQQPPADHSQSQPVHPSM